MSLEKLTEDIIGSIQVGQETAELGISLYKSLHSGSHADKLFPGLFENYQSLQGLLFFLSKTQRRFSDRVVIGRADLMKYCDQTVFWRNLTIEQALGHPEVDAIRVFHAAWDGTEKLVSRELQIRSFLALNIGPAFICNEQWCKFLEERDYFRYNRDFFMKVAKQD